LYDERLGLMLREGDPVYPNWDQDLTAVEEDYQGQGPGAVAAQLLEAAARLAASFEAVRGEQWQRRGRRSDGASFTIASFGRYMIHDPVHHLYDVTGERAG
jgi:GNAT superfamily N-acetyltransferase